MKTISAELPPDPGKRPAGPPTKKSKNETENNHKPDGQAPGENERQPTPEHESHKSITNADEQNKITNADSNALAEKEQEGV
jgi:hypothetical protein